MICANRLGPDARGPDARGPDARGDFGPDRTKENQLAHNKLVKEMKQMIERDPCKHYFIRQRKICSVDKDLSSHTPAGLR